MSIKLKLYDQILEMRDISMCQKYIISYVHSITADNKICNISIDFIIKLTRMSKATVYREYKKLFDNHILEDIIYDDGRYSIKVSDSYDKYFAGHYLEVSTSGLPELEGSKALLALTFHTYLHDGCKKHCRCQTVNEYAEHFGVSRDYILEIKKYLEEHGRISQNRTTKTRSKTQKVTLVAR